MTIRFPNGTEEKVITHSAIASWAGFIYQGLCALCVTIEKILDNPNEAKKWFLNIEGYEDFAILDENKNILSFHQCKDYKTNSSMTDEFQKMVDKRAYWCQKNICKANVPLYFHTNMDITFPNCVQLYTYKDGTKNPNTNGIYMMLGRLVKDYCAQNPIPTSAERATNRLIALIEDKVCYLDVEAKKSQQQAQQLSIANSIPFSEIINRIESSNNDMKVDEKVRASVFYIKLYLIKNLDFPENNTPKNIDTINNFLDGLNAKDANEQKKFIKRLFPDIDIEQNSQTEISNSPRVNYLFKVLTKTTQELDYKPMNWRENECVISPSTMGNDMQPEQYCDKIATNPSLPPEILRDYDWIVGYFDQKVDDIIDAAKNICNVEPVNYYDITQPHKTGLLTINDKNNGNF